MLKSYLRMEIRLVAFLSRGGARRSDPREQGYKGDTMSFHAPKTSARPVRLTADWTGDEKIAPRSRTRRAGPPIRMRQANR
jgi:hypothetical protein